jgi:hypothetical protein
MKQYFAVLLLSFIGLNVYAQNVGIGTTTPTAGLHIVNNNGIVAKGTLNAGAVINESGTGSRFIFYPRKGAIRGGYLDGTSANYWDDASTGLYSIGFGYNARATGMGSIAVGSNAWALDENSLALGYNAIAAAPYSIVLSTFNCNANAPFTTAIGAYLNANAYGSVAIGRNITAGNNTIQGQYSFCIGTGDNTGFNPGSHYTRGTRGFAIGNNCGSAGSHTFAIGNDCSAGYDFSNDNSGRYAFAFGNTCNASGIYSFAFGNNANTNLHTGSMVLGSRIDGVQVNSPGDYHFLAQFAGGYQLQSNDAGTLGVYLQPNTSVWASLCDSNRKELVMPMNDEETLEKLSAINYSSWKYIDDPDVTNRHYGIMAQDFYASFGRDALGKIGSDTLVNPIDLLGVAYSAIKALEKRTDEIEVLKNENEQLKARLEKLEMMMLKKK